MKKVLISAAGVCAVCAGAGIYGYNKYMKDALAAVKLVRSFAEEKEMSLEVKAEAGAEKMYVLAGEVYRTPLEDWDVFTVDLPQMDVWFTDGRLVLENGIVWNTGTLPKVEVKDLTAAIGLARYAEVTKDAETGVYTIALDEEKLGRLVQELKIAVPEMVGELHEVTVDVGENSLHAAVMADLGRTEFSAVKTDAQQPAIPSAVQEAILSDKQGKDLFSEENLRLCRGVLQLAAQETISADVNLQAELAFLKIGYTMSYDRTAVEDMHVGMLSSDSVRVYMANGKIVGPEGSVVSQENQSLADSLNLTQMVPGLVLSGMLECEPAEDGSYVYFVDLDDAATEEVLNAAVPQASALGLENRKGRFHLNIAQDTITSAGVGVEGTISFFGLEITSGFSMDAVFTQRTVEVPQAVVDALK